MISFSSCTCSQLIQNENRINNVGVIVTTVPLKALFPENTFNVFRIMILVCKNAQVGFFFLYIVHHFLFVIWCMNKHECFHPMYL